VNCAAPIQFDIRRSIHNSFDMEGWKGNQVLMKEVSQMMVSQYRPP
jgi:hypothetical protein